MVYVTGAGMVKVGRHFDLGARDLAFQAVEGALEGSGVEDIDYLIVTSSISYLEAPQLDLSAYIASELGVNIRRSIAVEAGESSGLAGVEVALALLRSHAAERVLVVGVDKLTEYPSGETYRMLEALYDTESDALYNIGHASVAALLMRLYMDRYGVSRETLAYWPAVMHANAKSNKYAMLPFAVTPEKVLKAMPVAEPITLLDSYPLGDGAAAVLLSSEECKGDHLAKIIDVYSGIGMPSIALRGDPLSIEALEGIAAVTDIPGFKPDVVETHDSFSIIGVLTLEALGLAPKGEAAKLMMEGYFSRDGDGPLVNASGGLKARGHPIGATDVYKVAEVALQLAGKFEGVSRSGARRGLVVSLNAHGSSARVAFMEAL